MRRSLKMQGPVEQLLAVAHATADMALNYASTGNVSVRTEHGIYISSSGSRCDELSAGDLVLISLDNKVLGGVRPSSEWPFHREIYLARPDVGAIVHCHSPAASVVAGACCDIPTSFHYMALAHTAGGDRIRCAPYEVPGSEALARETVRALGMGNACLLGVHGQVAVGKTPREALDHAIMLEHLCYLFASLHPNLKPVPIPADKLAATALLFKNYGK